MTADDVNALIDRFTDETGAQLRWGLFECQYAFGSAARRDLCERIAAEVRRRVGLERTRCIWMACASLAPEAGVDAAGAVADAIGAILDGLPDAVMARARRELGAYPGEGG